MPSASSTLSKQPLIQCEAPATRLNAWPWEVGGSVRLTAWPWEVGGGVSQTEWMALGGWGVSQPKPYVYTSSAENSAALIEKGEVDL